MARLQTLKLRVHGKEGSLDIYKQLKGTAFTEYHAFFTLCVFLGYRDKKRVKGRRKEQLFWSDTFTPDEYAAFDSILIKESNAKDFSMLNEGESLLQTLEEYANAGLDLFLNSDVFSGVFADVKGGKVLQVSKQDFIAKQLMYFIYSEYQNV